MKKKKDVYLKSHVLLIGIGFVLIGTLSAYYIYRESPSNIILAAIPFVFGIYTLLCWNNQWIKMINDREFVHSNAIGIKKTYRFSDITKVEKHINAGGIFYSYINIHIAKEIIHIEGNAIVSKQFSDKINAISGQKLLF